MLEKNRETKFHKMFGSFSNDIPSPPPNDEKSNNIAKWYLFTGILKTPKFNIKYKRRCITCYKEECVHSFMFGTRNWQQKVHFVDLTDLFLCWCFINILIIERIFPYIIKWLKGLPESMSWNGSTEYLLISASFLLY